MKTTTQLTSIALLTALSCSVASAALTTTTTYTGGDALTAGNWTSGRPTSTGNAGLMDGANGWGGGGADYHIRMTGGTINANGGGTGGWAMQGGANGTSSIIEIDDTGGTALAFTGAGRFTMWNSPAITGSTGNELRMLNGSATFGEFWANGGTDARVDILNGTFNADALADNGSAVVTMKDGGTGAFNIGDIQSTAVMDQMLINFETGSLASFTIGNIAGATTQGYWETKIAAGKVQVDGVAKTGTNRFVIEDAGALGTTLTLNPNPLNYYDGSGALSDAANWDLGLPTNANPGLVSTTDGAQDFGGDTWVYSFQLSQTGGTITDPADSGIALRGGADNTTDNCTFEIDDASNTAFGTKNLYISGQLTLWNQYQANGSTGNIFSVLNGYADVAILAGTNSANSTINLLNGKLDVGYFSNANLTVNMLNGGTGQFNLADMYGTSADAAHKSKLSNMILNFETGSLASFTIAADNGGSAVGAWETKIAAGQVKIDGVAKTNTSLFIIANAGASGTTISLDPNPSNGYNGSGDLTSAANWALGVPTNTNPGIISTTDGAQNFGSEYWVHSFQLSQTGGTITDTADVGIALRGGAENTTDNSIYEIDDASNTDFSTTNLDVSGLLTLWNQYGGTGSTGNTFSVTNGYANVAQFAGANTANSTVNILNGKLDVGNFENARVTVNMLTGGTGEFNLADMYGTSADAAHKSKLSNMILNFETGSLASFTIASNDGASAVGAWETKIAAGQVKVDGAANTALSNFVITQVVDAATISLLPTLMINSDDLTLGDIDGTVTAIFAADSSGNLTLGDLNGGTVNVSFGSGSSSSVVLADYVSGSTILVNFEPGSEASFTISSKAGGGNSGGLWEWWINNTDRISIGGVPSNDVSDFVIVWDGGTGNTISLAPTTPAADPEITSITSLGSGNFELTLKGEPSTSYEFYSSATLDFTSGGDLVPLTGDGTDGTDVTTDVSGNATVQMSLAGSANFVRAQ